MQYFTYTGGKIKTVSEAIEFIITENIRIEAYVSICFANERVQRIFFYNNNRQMRNT